MGDAHSFTPMWASPPGQTIRTRLYELGLDVPDLAKRLGISPSVVDGLLDGRAPISVEIARRLSQVVGGSVEFWVSRDCQYRDDLIRVETDQWLSDLPVQEMTRLGWIRPDRDWTSRVSACLSFFGVEDIKTWRATYEPILTASRMRISATVPRKNLAVAAWLRKATCEAEAVDVARWDASLMRESLEAIKRLTRRKDPSDFLPKLRSLLAKTGVALVVLRTLPGCPASGAARFMSTDRAMIVVSGRFLADDQFWFTVIHEIGHLLLHGSQNMILDDPYSYDKVETQEEREANRFAADVLLPAGLRTQIPPSVLTHRDVISLSIAAGVSPGIIVGQLQFENRIGRNQLNMLKRRYKWSGPSLEMV